MVLRLYQNVKSIGQAVFKLPRSQAISCIGYNVNLQTAVAAILIFVECPKSIASEVLLVLRPYQNVKSIRQAVFKLTHSQTISYCGGHLDFRRMPLINSFRGLSSINPYQNRSQSDKRFSRYLVQKQLWTDGQTDRQTDRQGHSIIRHLF